MKFTLSVAIVTRNRPTSLERTLISLREQNIQPYEVLISDDSNIESLKNDNEQLAKKYMCIYINGPQLGLYANRNFIARVCSGTHIRTMDDDHEFPDDHINACIQAIYLEPDTIWTIGEYLPNEMNRILPPLIPGQLHPRGYSVPPLGNKYYGISCGATIYPRKVIDENNLNIDIYKFGILYLEYGIRLFKKGYKIKFLPTTYIIHHFEENNRSFLIQEITDRSRLLSMFLFSFYYIKSLKNILYTSSQVIYEIIIGRYSYRLVLDTIVHCRKIIKSFNNL